MIERPRVGDRVVMMSFALGDFFLRSYRAAGRKCAACVMGVLMVTCWLAGIIITVMPLPGFAQSPLWTHARNATVNRDSILGCAYGTKPGKFQARDQAGNIFVTGCAANPLSYDILTYKINGLTGEVLWSASFSGSSAAAAIGANGGQAIAVDKNGDVVVTGLTSDVNGGKNIRTIKYSGGNGAELWNVSYNGPGNGDDEGAAVATDSAGDVFVAGQSSEAGVYPGGFSSLRTIKYSGATGALVWTNAIDAGLALGIGRAVAVDGSDNVYVTGPLYRPATGSDIVTVKYSGSTGAELWQTNYGAPGDHYDIALTAGGNVLVAGHSYDGPAGISPRITKYGGVTGNLIWTGAANCEGTFHAMAVDAGGGIGLAGQCNGAFYTAKYADISGAFLWSASLGGGTAGLSDAGIGIAVNSDGDFAVTGTILDSPSTLSLRALKYSGSNGQVLWSKTYAGGAGNENRGRNALFDGSGELIVSGTSAYLPGRSNILTIKYSNLDGSQLWTSINPAITSFVAPIAVASGPDGDVAVLASDPASGDQVAVRVTKYSRSTGNELWSVVYDGGVGGSESGRALAFDPSGNVLVTDVSTGLVPGGRIRTMKLAAATGSQQWNVVYDCSSDNSFLSGGTALAIDQSGGVYVTGACNAVAGQLPSRIIKYELDTGAELWNVAFSASVNPGETSTAIALGGDGGVYVVGNGNDGIDGLARAIKYSASTGDQIWATHYGGNGTAAHAVSASVDSGNNLILAGGRFSAQSEYDYLAVKFDATTGAQIWSKFSDGGSGLRDTVADIKVDMAGNVFLTGYGQVPGGYTRMQTIKFDGSTGSQLWRADYAGEVSGTAFARSISLDAGGNPRVAGISQDLAGYYNIHAIRYNGATGVMTADYAYDGSSHGVDDSVKIVVGEDGAEYILGSSLEFGKPQNELLIKLGASGVPGAPVITSVVQGNDHLDFQLAAPLDIGSSALNGYAVTCIRSGQTGGVTVTGPNAPVRVTNLAPGFSYQCRAQALNASGAGPLSPSTAVVFSQQGLLQAESRKSHGGVDYGLPIDLSQPITGNLTVEPRAGYGGHRIVFSFDAPVSVPGTLLMTDSLGVNVGSAMLSAQGSTVVADLTGIPDKVRARLVLSGVNGRSDQYVANIGFLVADVNGSLAIDDADVAAAKLRAGQAVTSANFQFDVNTTGVISAADILAVKARKGSILP